MSGHPVQEEDKIATGKIVLTAVVSLSIFGIGALWSISIQRGENGTIISQDATGAIAAKEQAPEVGIVYQWPFFTSQFANDKAIETKWRLSHYGWIDKNAKVVHIPIDQAIQKYVSQAGGGQK